MILRGFSENAGRRRPRLLGPRVQNTRDAWKSMCVWKLKGWVSQVCPRVGGAPRVSTGRRRLTRRVEATLVYTNTIDKRRWSRSPRVKRSDTLLSAEMKFIFTVNTWRHTQTGVFSRGFELRTKKEKKWNKGEEKKKNSLQRLQTCIFLFLKK